MNKLQSIKRACRITDQAFAHILKNIKIGVTEKELAAYSSKYMRSQRAKLAFRPIVAFGKNAFEIHHKPKNKKLNRKDGFILIDIGAKVNGYCSDMSRTVFIGHATKEQKKIYLTVLEAQKKALSKVRTNVKVYELDKIARDYIVKKGFDPIPHSLGHGVGQKVHERPKICPVSSETLSDGIIFTIEPGIYIKGYGGVRIEDVYYLNKGRTMQLTKSPKNLTELV